MASLVLTAKENGTQSQAEFLCYGMIHGYLRLPERMEGDHTLEAIWIQPNNKQVAHSKTVMHIPAPGRSTAYVWFAFPETALLGSINTEEDAQRLGYPGLWKVDVRWDEKPLVSSVFKVGC